MGEPRHTCRNFMMGKAPVELEKSEFDQLMDDNCFDEGPYFDTFGDGNGEPYNPRRQVYGVVKDGRAVFAELTKEVTSDG